MVTPPKDRPAIDPSGSSPQYALVAYVRGELGRFVERLRGDLYPEHSHLAAHITVLPPRVICGTEQEAIGALRVALSEESPFEVTLGGVESFFPTTPTVFIRVSGASERFRQLHVRLNQGFLCFKEQWSYEPHLTIVKMPSMAAAEDAFREAMSRWSGFTGARSLRVGELAFVREDRRSTHWLDIARFSLEYGC